VQQLLEAKQGLRLEPMLKKLDHYRVVALD
jgi:hypothetical protein